MLKSINFGYKNIGLNKFQWDSSNIPSGVYLLSLNDYYINMNIIYNENNSYISEFSFYQAPYWVHVQDLIITSLDSIPYNYAEWDNYEAFDLR